MDLRALRRILVALGICLLALGMISLLTRDLEVSPDDAWYSWLELLAGCAGLWLAIPRARGKLLPPTGASLIMAGILLILWIVADASAVSSWLTWTNGGMMIVYLLVGVFGTTRPSGEILAPEIPDEISQSA